VAAIDRLNLPAVVRLRALFVTTREWAGRLPLSVIQLAMRVAVGSVFFKSGLLKANSFEFAVKLFEDEYRLPLLDPTWAARLAAFTEITFPLFLFAGLATRLATLPLLFMTLVIQVFVYPDAWVENLMWASILVFLLTRGPGVLSADHLVERWLAKRD
jgi:putative oxidoreductase